MLNEKRIRQVKELEVKYETAEKQAAIQLLEKDKATQRINVIDTQKPNFTATPANVTVLGNSYAEEEGAENRKDPADAAQNSKFKI